MVDVLCGEKILGTGMEFTVVEKIRRDVDLHLEIVPEPYNARRLHLLAAEKIGEI